MKLEFLNFKNQKNLINGVVLRQLTVHQDQRGVLVETLKNDWQDVFGRNLPFGQSYLSKTLPGFARDENLWHFHPRQTDRFVVIKGSLVFALFDWRKNSPTGGFLNLFLMGEENKNEDPYLLLIPPNVLHAFCVVSRKPCFLLAYPTQLYDPSEEGRIPYKDVGAKFPDSSPFSWELVRKEFKAQR